MVHREYLFYLGIKNLESSNSFSSGGQRFLPDKSSMKSCGWKASSFLVTARQDTTIDSQISLFERILSTAGNRLKEFQTSNSQPGHWMNN